MAAGAYCAPSKSPTHPTNVPTGPGGGGSGGGTIAYDPNQKLGPAGYGPQNFVSAEGRLDYRIDFENDASATAPAQIVLISDPLDANFDFSTFELTEIGFGDILLSIPSGSQYYETTVTFSNNDQTFGVEIMAGINLASGEVYAAFYSIDPSTGLPPEGLIGFLPPEDGTGRGMGYFSYTVQPGANAVTGDEIRNIAYITFDGAETIPTNAVDPHDPQVGTDPDREALVTIDANIPASEMLALPPETDMRDFLVEWAGWDNTSGIEGAGVATYDVYYRQDDGDWMQIGRAHV